jgi:hypothetical protein
MPVTNVAIHAALMHEHQKQVEEEEKMTRYTTEDLQNDWEFKIVRSTFGAFRKPEVLQALIEEEAQAGWKMIEKFDDYRIRFKRPMEARKRDVYLPQYLDPYRTQYGRKGNRNAMVRIGLMLSAVLLAAALVFLLLRAG